MPGSPTRPAIDVMLLMLLLPVGDTLHHEACPA